MKKYLASLVLAVAMLACVSCIKKKTEVNDTKGSVTKIGIGKIISHPSLDAVEKGIEDELTESGTNVKIDKQNANGDVNTASSIASKFKAEKDDIAVGIATPMAVALAGTITDKPVIFAAITDPISASLVENMNSGYKNVNGVTDAIPIREQINEFRKIYPFKKLGFIYANAEANAASMAAETEKVCKELGIDFIPAAVANTSEIKQAAESLAGRADAFYVTNDNTLVAGVNALLETAKVNKIPVFSGDITSSLDGGALYAMGFDYYNMGRAAGKMILQILDGAKPDSMPVKTLTDPSDYLKLVDLDSAEALGITVPAKFISTSDYIIQNGTLIKKGEK